MTLLFYCIPLVYEIKLIYNNIFVEVVNSRVLSKYNTTAILYMCVYIMRSMKVQIRSQ